MILIAVGANLPGDAGAQPLVTCRSAAEALQGLPGLRLVAASHWYLTAPLPASSDPDYVNGVLRLEGHMEPAVLLRSLQRVESAAGRRRGLPNAPRTLDLDIVAIGDLVRNAPDPILPHPRAHERAFVLRPLLDVAPHWVHPRLHVPARELLARLQDHGVRRA